MKKTIKPFVIDDSSMWFYDIETSYTVGAVWGLYEQNVAKVIREPFIYSIAYKKLGSKTVFYKCIRDFPLYKKDKFSDKALVQFIKDHVFSKGAIYVAHNGNGFDLKWIYGRFAIHRITPPVPKQHIDTLLICRNKFNFNSNKLKDLLIYFGLPNKVETGGIDLWYNTIELGIKKYCDLMKKYNMQDVASLEALYLVIRPFITNHPNLALMTGERIACPNCGSLRMTKSKLKPTRAGWKMQWQCQDCASYHTSPLKEGTQIR